MHLVSCVAVPQMWLQRASTVHGKKQTGVSLCSQFEHGELSNASDLSAVHQPIRGQLFRKVTQPVCCCRGFMTDSGGQELGIGVGDGWYAWARAANVAGFGSEKTSAFVEV